MGSCRARLSVDDEVDITIGPNEELKSVVVVNCWSLVIELPMR